jgi:hypothetical protein
VSSSLVLSRPLDFLIKTPDGIEATDFQLVHLHEKTDAREFRTMTGGVFHRSGGSSRDAVDFVQTRTAKHIYKIRLAANLPRGGICVSGTWTYQLFRERLYRQGIYISTCGVVFRCQRRNVEATLKDCHCIVTRLNLLLRRG